MQLCQRAVPAWAFIANAFTDSRSLHRMDVHSFIDKHLSAEQTWTAGALLLAPRLLVVQLATCTTLPPL